MNEKEIITFPFPSHPVLKLFSRDLPAVFALTWVIFAVLRPAGALVSLGIFGTGVVFVLVLHTKLFQRLQNARLSLESEGLRLVFDRRPFGMLPEIFWRWDEIASVHPGPLALQIAPRVMLKRKHARPWFLSRDFWRELTWIAVPAEFLPVLIARLPEDVVPKDIERRIQAPSTFAGTVRLVRLLGAASGILALEAVLWVYVSPEAPSLLFDHLTLLVCVAYMSCVLVGLLHMIRSSWRLYDHVLCVLLLAHSGSVSTIFKCLLLTVAERRSVFFLSFTCAVMAVSAAGDVLRGPTRRAAAAAVLVGILVFAATVAFYLWGTNRADTHGFYHGRDVPRKSTAPSSGAADPAARSLRHVSLRIQRPAAGSPGAGSRHR